MLASAPALLGQRCVRPGSAARQPVRVGARRVGLAQSACRSGAATRWRLNAIKEAQEGADEKQKETPKPAAKKRASSKRAKVTKVGKESFKPTMGEEQACRTGARKQGSQLARGASEGTFLFVLRRTAGGC